MKFAEFADAADKTSQVLSGGPKTEEQFLIYFEELRDMDGSSVLEALKVARRELDYFPKIAWIREYCRSARRPERLSGFQLPPAPIDGSGCPRHVREYMKLQAREGGRLFAELAQARRTVRSRLQAQGGGVQQHRIDADETVKAVLQKIDGWKHFDRDKQQQMQTLKEALADQPVEDLEPLEFSYEFTIEGEEVEF
jgi:hypothetical protein